jgi:Holliday junction resolvase RusA-like endonuclease
MANPKGLSEMKLILPYPPSELLPNKKSTWLTKMRVSREYKDQCYYELVAQLYHAECKSAPIPCALTITFYPPSKKIADYDSLYRALKPGTDALVLTGVLEDDSPEVIDQVTLRMGEVDKVNPRTEIEITEILKGE